MVVTNAGLVWALAQNETYYRQTSVPPPLNCVVAPVADSPHRKMFAAMLVLFSQFIILLGNSTLVFLLYRLWFNLVDLVAT